jgi:hypothetical protein
MALQSWACSHGPAVMGLQSRHDWGLLHPVIAEHQRPAPQLREGAQHHEHACTRRPGSAHRLAEAICFARDSPTTSSPGRTHHPPATLAAPTIRPTSRSPPIHPTIPCHRSIPFQPIHPTLVPRPHHSPRAPLPRHTRFSISLPPPPPSRLRMKLQYPHIADSSREALPEPPCTAAVPPAGRSSHESSAMTRIAVQSPAASSGPSFKCRPRRPCNAIALQSHGLRPPNCPAILP